jgi:hypothetical protein
MKIKHSEKEYLESLVKYINDPKSMEREIEKSINGLVIATILGVLSLVIFSAIYSNDLVFAAAGFMIGIIWTMRSCVRNSHQNMLKKIPFLDESAIRVRIKELDV